MGYKKDERVRIINGFDAWHKEDDRKRGTTEWPFLHDGWEGSVIGDEERVDNIVKALVAVEKPDGSGGFFLEIPVCFLVRIAENEGKA